MQSSLPTASIRYCREHTSVAQQGVLLIARQAKRESTVPKRGIS